MNTVVIMECKSELCKILQLLCTMRLDIRLSQLLARYETEWGQRAWEAQVYSDRAKEQGLADVTSAAAPADDIHWASRFVNPGDSGGGGGGGGYARLLDEGSTPGF